MKNPLVQFALVLGLLSFAACCNKGSDNWKPNPPYQGLETQMTAFSINPLRDTVLILPSGTSLTIPHGSFVDAGGNPVSGNVDVLYREFHDAVDILLAGITMDYNSMDEKRTLTTAGMFELDAKSKGQQLAVAKGKKIDVRLASNYPGTNYNFFYMNPQTSAWEWVDLPTVEVNQEKIDAKEALANKMPSLFMGDEYFVLSYDRFLDYFLNDDWYKIQDHRNDKSIRRKLEEYKVKMYDVVARGEVLFGKSYYHPIELLWKDLDGKAIPKWTSDFEFSWEKNAKGDWYISNFNLKKLEGNRYEIYYKLGKKTFTKQMEAIIPLKNLLRLPAAEWQKRYDEAMAQLAEEQAKVDLMAETYRTFSVSRLGIYNFDALLKMDNWFEIMPSFTLNSSQTTNGDVVIILGDNSGYIKLNPEQYSTMRINPESGHRVIMLLPNNEIAIYPVEQFKGIDIESLRAQTKPPYTFALESKKVNSAVELRKILGF